MPAQLEAAVDHRMHDHAAGIRLVGVAAELPAFAEPARDRREIRLFAQHARESALAFDRPPGGGEIIFGEERGGEAVARGRSEVETFRHAAQHLDQSRALRGREPERPGHAQRVEAEELARGGGGAEHSAGAADVPAALVMPWRNGVADAAFGLDAENECVQQVLARCGPLLGEGEQRRRDRRARVDHGGEVRVVEVQNVGAHRVDERGEQRVEPLAAADKRRLRRSGVRRERGERALDRAPERAAEEIEERALGFVPHRRRQVACARVDEEAREPGGDGVFCHEAGGLSRL